MCKGFFEGSWLVICLSGREYRCYEECIFQGTVTIHGVSYRSEWI